MKNLLLISIVFLVIFSSCEKQPEPSNETPPFDGTISLDPDIITESDPTTFVDITYVGTGTRSMFDRRVDDWITVDPFLFNANYDDGLSIEIQINPEFGTKELAEIEAEKYAIIFGRLPTSLRKDVQTSWIHQGTEPFGGGNNNLLIHTGQTVLYENDGILEETLVHEASHTSLDAIHSTSQGWLDAQKADSNFISTYARDNPTREDVAETFLLYLALRYRSERISEDLRQTIENTIPNRIQYLDNQTFNLYPIE